MLLTETTKDPDLKLDNYAYRDPNYNEINGDEKRLLNGEFLLPEKRLYSLIDSTPEKNTPLGEAYHIWIPYIILYGYDWSRSGEIEVKDGTFFNIRTFAKPYGDYTGNFQDNPFTLRVTQKPVEKDPPPDLSYSDEAVKTFTDLADTTEGEMIYAKGPEDILSTIKEILKKGEKDHLDLLFALDSTESMKDDVEEVRKNISSMLAETLPQYKTYRIALVLYKDYREDFLVREACVFTDNLKKFEKPYTALKFSEGGIFPKPYMRVSS